MRALRTVRYLPSRAIKSLPAAQQWSKKARIGLLRGLREDKASYFGHLTPMGLGRRLHKFQLNQTVVVNVPIEAWDQGRKVSKWKP
jgi:hypothetical protein